MAPAKPGKAPQPEASEQEPESAATMDPSRWQQVLDQLDTKGGEFFFPQDGRSRMKIVVQPGTDESRFFVETKRVFNGQERNRYLVLAVIVGSENEDDRSKVKPVILAKTALKGILSLLAEGYNLLGWDGYGITLARSGKGLETDYNVMPSQRPIKLNPDDLQWPEGTIDEIAVRFYENSKERDKNRTPTGNGEEKTGRPRKTESSGDDW